MPQLILCEQCRSVLYEGSELKPPEEIIMQYDGVCPGCGKKLTFELNNVEIKMAE